MAMNETCTTQIYDIRSRLEAGESVCLLDVRTPAEFREKHIEGSLNIPLDQLSVESITQQCGDDRDLFFVCKSGARSMNARQQMEKAGLAHVHCVDGGLEAWEREGLPLTRGKKSIPLERQVMIALGSMILPTTLLGAFVNPWFLAFPLFFACGMLFAGLSGFCGLAMVLAKMPWNR